MILNLCNQHVPTYKAFEKITILSILITQAMLNPLLYLSWKINRKTVVINSAMEYA